MYLFESIGKETISKEYKEFSFKIDMERYYDIEEVNTIVKTGKLDERFNRVVIDNLKHYSKYYIPKYISSFCNSSIDVEYSTLYFGVDDYGEITGIPYLRDLDEESIKSYILNCIKENIITTDVQLKFLLKHIDIKLHTLEVNDLLVYNELDKIIGKLEEDYKNYKIEYDRYMSLHSEWYLKLSKYSTKLITISKTPETANELRQYILNNDPEKIYVITQDISKMIERVDEYKYNPDNYLYWICRFRDERIDELLKTKPSKPHTRVKYVNYSSEFVKLEKLRKLFLDNNKDMKYYLLEIKLPNKCKDDVFYRDISGLIKKKVRTLDEQGEPICI